MITRANNQKEHYDNISFLNERFDQVIKYMQENPNSDINAYELNDLIYSFAEIGNNSRNFEKEPYETFKDPRYQEILKKFRHITTTRIAQLRNPKNGLETENNHVLSDYFLGNISSLASLNSLGNKNDAQITSKICGIYLYIQQRKRELARTNRAEIIYDNKEEFKDLTMFANEHGIQSYHIDNLKTMVSEIENSLGKTYQMSQNKTDRDEER